MASNENEESNSLRIKSEPIESANEKEQSTTNDSAAASETVIVKQEPTHPSENATNVESGELAANVLDEIAPQLDEVLNSLRTVEDPEVQEQPTISVKNEPTENTAPAVTENNDDEGETYAELTPNFFDDLVPPPEENINSLEDLPEEELERKYSEKLREYISLGSKETQSGSAQKRASETPEEVTTKRARPDENARPSIRLRTTTELSSVPETRTPRGPVHLKTEFDDDDGATQANIECLQVGHNNTRSNEQRESQSKTLPVDVSRIKVEKVFEEFDDFGRGVDLPGERKRQIAMDRVTAAIHLFKNMTFGQKSLLHTDTVRRLPTHMKYLSQQYYDNRSPLHTNNVPFAFSTPGGNVKLSDWGLEPLSPTIAKITKVLGYDVHVLYYKTMVARKPIYLPRTDTQKEVIVENASTFYNNAMTQTNISGPVTKVKFKSNISVQTDLPTTSSDLTATVQKFPFLKNMHNLNSNQLLALNDFVELMHKNDIASDVFRLREALLHVYNTSRMPVMDANTANYSNFLTQQQMLAQQQQQQQQQQMFAQQQQQQQQQQQIWQNQQGRGNFSNGVSSHDPRRRNHRNMPFNR